ncbi:MAG: nucleotidyltransferase domain-containing protein [Candidatus Margulisbacteria bacterium]|nr:nucleotidyltransferase domain-containing protein [Candidatus Margulisiibacteriota bacterium]
MVEREVNLKDLTVKAVNYLSQYYSIEEIILFGSYVGAENDQWSDIDLAVVSPDFHGKTYEEIIQIFAELAVKYSSRLELRPYTPEDMKSARPTNFLGYILKNGKVIYKNNQILI